MPNRGRVSLSWNQEVRKMNAQGFEPEPKILSHWWFSKLWSPFGSPQYKVPYYTKDPKRDQKQTIILTTTHITYKFGGVQVATPNSWPPAVTIIPSHSRHSLGTDLFWSILYNGILYCSVLHYIILYDMILYYIILYYIIFYIRLVLYYMSAGTVAASACLG